MSWRISFLLAVVLAGCGGGDTSEIPLIRTSQEYDQVSAEVQKLTVNLITDLDATEREPTVEEVAKLRRARDLFDGMRGYRPREWGALFGAAKVNQLLGEHAKAIELYFECMKNAPIDDPAAKATGAEAAFQLSRIYERRGEFAQAVEAAKQAVRLVEVSPSYHAQLASAYLQANDEKAALKSLKRALELDPLNKRALQLEKFLKPKPKVGA